MGTINYFTSDYITLALNPEWELSEEEYDYYFSELKETIQDHDFYYYNITVKPGYYEGFSIDIEMNNCYFDDYEEKIDAQKEVTEIKKMFLDMIENDFLIACSPGWCTSYYDRNETKRKLREAVKEMRLKIKSTPTYIQYFRED